MVINSSDTIREHLSPTINSFKVIRFTFAYQYDTDINDTGLALTPKLKVSCITPFPLLF